MKRLIYLGVSLLMTFAVIVMSCGGGKIMVTAEKQPAQATTPKPTIEVFIENSGSMDGYMCAGSQLKDAVYDYVSDLNRVSDTTRLNYINSQIIPYKGGLQSYIKDLNPEQFKKAGGNLSNTDLGQILGKVFKSVTPNTVCLFVSDCILDLPSKDAQKYLTNCEITIKEEVISALKRVPEMGVEILKLSSDFSGKYFYPGGEVEMLTNVQRPYYMWVMGPKALIAELNKKVPLERLAKYNLKGICAFSSESDVPFDIQNRNLGGGVINERGGTYQATLRADFSGTLQPDGEVQNKANYSFVTRGIIVEGVYPITDKNSPYTHYVNISIPKDARIVQDALVFNTPKMPAWVRESNDETGENIKGNLSKTTGIKYLIQGVADAYRDQTVSAKMKFNVKKM